MNKLLIYHAFTNILCLIGFVSNAQVKHSKQDTALKPVLIFQNGFEGTSRVIRNISDNGKDISHYPIDGITGKDTRLKSKNDWAADLDGNPDGGRFMIEYTGGDTTKHIVSIIPEPGHPNNKILSFKLYDAWEASEHQIKARIQADIYHIKKGYKEFYQTERVFIPEEMNALRKYPDVIKWLTISEFWNNAWWLAGEKYGFRITLGIGKPVKEESDLVFIVNAENPGQKEVWNDNGHSVKVPVGKWFTMEYYLKEGDDKTGRFYMAITPDGGSKEVVFNVTNFTHNTFDPNPDGFTDYNPMKLYTSKELVSFMKGQGKVLEIYWDDIKLWKNKKPD